MSPPGDALLWRPDIGPVLVASGGEGATRRYRAVHLAEQLELAGIAACLAPRIDAALVAEAPAWPIVVLHRVAWDPLVGALIDRTRDGGGIVLFDVDDLVFEPESTRWHHGVQALSPAEQRRYHDGVRRYRRTLLACDGALVPTAVLAARVRRAGRPAFVHRNGLDVELAERSARAAAAVRAAPRRDDGRIVAGYASGTRTHDRDVSAACGPALRTVLARHPALELHLVGPLALDDAWAPLADRIVRRDAVDWRDLPALVASWDINLAPLEVDNLFCQCKSELKWLEAAACGVATVASRTQAFASALAGARGDEGGDLGDDLVGDLGGDAANVEPSGALGLLAVDEADWVAALEALVGDPARQAAIAAAAYDHVHAHRTAAAQAAPLAATLARAVAQLRPAAPPAPGERRATARLARAAAGANDDRRARRPALGADADVAAERRRVAVLMPEPPPGSGGHTSIFRMVAGLCDAGHDVTVHIDRGALMRRLDAAEAARYLADHFPTSPAAVRLDRAIDGADVAIATGWTTAAAVAHTPGVGTRLYFVQDYEPFFQPLSADYVAAAQTYRLGLGHITLGPWLAAHIATHFGGRARAIDFGVEHALYRPPDGPAEAEGGAGTPARRPRIVFYARAVTPRRGVALGLAALAQVAARRPDVEIVLYGGEPAHAAAPFPHVQAGVLDAPALAALYRTATVGLALSYTNLSFVPLEMMACGLPVVVAATEPAAWFQRDGDNCAVAEPTAAALADALLGLVDDPESRRRLAAGGRAAVAGLSWSASVAQFVAHVDAYVAEDRAAAAIDASVATINPGADVPDAAPPRTGPPPPRPAARRLGPQALDAGGARPLSPDATGRREWAFPLRPAADGLYRIDLRFAAVDAGPAAGLVVLRLKPHPTAPHDLAAVDRRVAGLVAGDWTPFVFPPLSDVAGRTLWAIVSHLPEAGASVVDTPTLAIALSTDAGAVDGFDAHPPLPAFRAWALDPVPPPGADDPAVFRNLFGQRRAAAELRRGAARRARRRGVAAALDAWAALTAPLPPVPLRPWPSDAPARAKLLSGLAHYGPLPVLRESIAAWRHRALRR